MKKFHALLEILAESDGFHQRRDPRVPSELTFGLNWDELRNPSAESILEIDNWLEALDEMFGDFQEADDAIWPEEGIADQPNSKPVTLAWYQQLYYYRANAGIFITDFGIWLYTRRLGRSFKKVSLQTPPSHKLVELAIELLLQHELFHHDVEWYSIKMSATHELHYLYHEYMTGFYGSSGPMEEGLASARMQLFLKTKQARDTWGQSVTDVAIAWLKHIAPRAPKGYDVANSYNSPATHKLGRKQLAAIINQKSLSPHWNPLGDFFDIGRGFLTEELRESVSIVSSQTTPPPMSLCFAVTLRKVERLLEAHGYRETKRGKGSHAVWVKHRAPMVTLPYRTELQGHDVINNLTRALGYSSREELKAAASRA